MGVILAFAATAALFVGTTSVPAVGDEAELLGEPVIPDTELIDEPLLPEIIDTPVVDDTPVPGDIAEEDIFPEIDPLNPLDPLNPEGLEGIDEFGELEAGLGLDLGLTPMDLGLAADVTPPYVTWTAIDEAGELVGGATFELQGPGGGWSGWGFTAEVEDNTGQEGYVGLDLDPAPGKFAVTHRGGHRISDSSRYRVQHMKSPSGYEVITTGWQQIPGTGGNPSRGAWVGQIYNFGEFSFLNTATELSCTPGTFYSVSSNGTLVEIANGTSTTIGRWAGMTGAANSVAISQGGNVVYAIDRNSTNAGYVNRILRYTPSTGVFEGLSGTQHNTYANALVAGAVDLSTGAFLYGGFSNNGARFQIYRYSDGGTPEYLGYFATGSTGTANGDMAFDAAGNLYVVRSGTTTNIYTVTAENLAAAAGGVIPATSTHSANLSGLSNVNGAAFDADGSIYLGNSTTVMKFDPTNWAYQGISTSNLNNSTDLASCSSPATLTVTKNVIGRANETDQFRLAVTGDGEELAAGETEGAEDGVQEQQIGPMAVRSGNTYVIVETFIEGAESEDYTTSLRCVDEMGTELINKPAASGEVTIPFVSGSTGAVVECEFTNAPLVSFVNITKHVKDENGSESPGAEWTVGAVAENSQNGTVTSAPAEATQETDGDGSAEWKFHYDTTDTVTDIAVSEQQQDGYEFDSGRCKVTAPTGETETIDLAETEDAIGGVVPGVVPGSTVNCDFYNQKMSSTLTLIKEIEGDHDPESNVDQWVLQAEGEDETHSGKTGDSDVTDVKVRPGTYTLSEALDTAYEGKAEGYTWERLVCVDNSEEPALTLLDADMTAENPETTVEIPNGADVDCTFTNSTKPGSIAWSKIVAGTDIPLAGSEWTLTGPGQAEGTLITDDGEGNFRVENLQWGDYTLTETTAPAGYQLDDPARSFTVEIYPPNLEWGQTSGSTEIEPIGNEQAGPVTLPIAGGPGTLAYLGGGMFLLLTAAGAWLFVTRRTATAGER